MTEYLPSFRKTSELGEIVCSHHERSGTQSCWLEIGNHFLSMVSCWRDARGLRSAQWRMPSKYELLLVIYERENQKLSLDLSHIQFIIYSLHIVDLNHTSCHDISIVITS
jgi:hypothetical protein